jgi:hypothetical protein
MPDFIHELIIMIIATLVVFAIVALKDRISIQRYYNTFHITPSVKIFYEWGHYVALDISWLKWGVSITLYIKEYNATPETEPWWGGNNDNPDKMTTGENTNATGNQTTNITDETNN